MIEFAVCILASEHPQKFCRVDLLEVNRFRCSPQSDYQTQVIAWDWDDEFRRYNVVAWMFTEGHDERTPRRIGDRWRVNWAVGDVIVESRLCSWTQTEHDPERENLKLHPKRRELRWKIEKSN